MSAEKEVFYQSRFGVADPNGEKRRNGVAEMEGERRVLRERERMSGFNVRGLFYILMGLTLKYAGGLYTPLICLYFHTQERLHGNRNPLWTLPTKFTVFIRLITQ